MHVAVYLYMLHHIVAVCLESAVEVMQILYTADLAGCRIEQLCGNSLRKRVVAFLLPSRHEVVALFCDHSVQFGNFIRAVLKIRVHGNDHISFRASESDIERRRFSIIARE